VCFLPFLRDSWDLHFIFKVLLKQLQINKEGDVMKKIIVLCIALMLVLVLSACGEGNASSGEHAGSFSIEQIQDAPQSFLGEISLAGIVGHVSSREFTLQNESATFEITVDYRGSQALPGVGDAVVVEGRLAENRPCCGPGFTLTSTRFQAVES